MKTPTISQNRMRLKLGEGGKKVLSFSILAIISTWLPLSAIAADMFDLDSKVVHLDDERGNATIWTLKTGGARFSFVAPLNWGLATNPSRKMIGMTSPDYRSIINVKYGTPLPELKPDAELSKLRELVKQRFPKARIIEEFICHSASGDARAFDLELGGESHQSLLRIAFVPLKDATLELTLQSSPDHFETTKRSLAGLLNSFEPVKDGKQAK